MLAGAEFFSETAEEPTNVHAACGQGPEILLASVGGCTQPGEAACGFLSFDPFTTWLLICSRPGAHALLASNLSRMKGSRASLHSGSSPVMNSKSTD